MVMREDPHHLPFPDAAVSTVWLTVPTPAIGTSYHLCSPKSCKPLLMPASHPQTPPGCPRTHITHTCRLWHPSFLPFFFFLLLFPSALEYEQPTRQKNRVAAHCPGPRCAGVGRVNTATRPALAGAGCLQEQLSGFLRLPQRWKRYCTSLRRRPVPCITGHHTRGKCFIKILHFVPLKWGREGFTERAHTEPVLTSHRSPQEKVLDNHYFKRLICGTLQLS